MSFTRMDQGKIEDWMLIGQAVMSRQAGMPAIIKSMLAQLEEQIDGFAVNQVLWLANRNACRTRRCFRGDGRRLVVSRHRKGNIGRESSGNRSRDTQALCLARDLRNRPHASGFSGPPLLRTDGQGPGCATPVRRRT